MFIILLFILFSTLVYFWYCRNIERKRICKYLEGFNGPKTKPIIGNLMDIGTNSVVIMQNINRIQQQYGPITKLFLGPDKISLLVSDPEFVEVILTSNKEITKGADYEMLRPWLFNGLLLSTGKYWQKRRKLLTPSFHFKILDTFIPIFNAQSDVLIEKLTCVLDKPSVNIWPYITAFTMDSICETAMGTSINAQRSPQNDYFEAVKVMCNNYEKRRYSFWKRNDFLFKLTDDYKERENALKILHGFTKSVIEQKRKQFNNSDINKKIVDEENFGRKKKIAFLDLIIQEGGDTLTDKHILEEVEVFMFGGHDTTATAACFALYEIARNSCVQDKLVKEQTEIFGENLEVQPTMQDLNNMKYMDLVLKETLRKYPAIPYFGRLLQHDLVFKDKIIPKGVNLMICAYQMHNDPNIYKDPEEFDPDRFSTENLHNRHSFAYVPFSGGPRNCIGQKFAFLELKVLISKILHNFHLLPADPQCDLILSSDVILKSVNGVCIQLQKRKI